MQKCLILAFFIVMSSFWAEGTMHPKEYYRFYSPEVQYLPLRDKGLIGAEIGREAPQFGSTEPIPRAAFIESQLAKVSNYPQTTVPVELLEEDGISRNTPVCVGFPLPQGAIWNLDNICVRSPQGNPIQAQKAITAIWPDKSVRWCLLQFNTQLAAHECSNYHIVFGKGIDDKIVSTDKLVTESPQMLTIDTGILSATINRSSFSFLEGLRVNGVLAGSFDSRGLIIRNEQGESFGTGEFKPEIIKVTENGPLFATVLVEGRWGNAHLGKYTVRLHFQKGSAVVTMELSWCNDELTREFTDLTSLTLSFKPTGGANSLRLEDIALTNAGRIFQEDDKRLAIDNVETAHRLLGSGDITSAGKTSTFYLHDAWQRYPKAFNLKEGQVIFELLPEQPSSRFGTDLPFYLQFPFCEGKYRFKWGIRFTESLTFDFSGNLSQEYLRAKSIVPFVSPEYIEKNKLLPGVFASPNNVFAEWDKRALSAFQEHLDTKERQREYGFLNYGDFFGERGINWTNNEYDFAHGLDMLFFRTGNRDCFRWARIAARHQADVDIIHAYPDPLYNGTQNQHAIAHTGAKKPKNATWSYFLNDNNWGNAGHTWSMGMIESWVLTGDANVMDSALALGEHLVRYASPMFRKLGTHERSAGWLIKAIIPFYRMTGDKRYLRAAERVAEIALQEQKPEEGGAWPHRLPGEHAGFYRPEDTYGNCPFLINVLLEGLRVLYEDNHDKRLANSIINGAKWLALSFDSNQFAWPYASLWDGRPCTKVRNNDNMLAASGMMFGALLSDNREIFEKARNIMLCSTFLGANPFGNLISIDLCFAAELMDGIVAFQKRHPEVAPYYYSLNEIVNMLERRKEPQFRIRGPEYKSFLLRLKKDNPTLEFCRLRHGSRPKAKQTCRMRVVDSSGKCLVEKTFQTSTIRINETLPLKGKAGEELRVEIADDLTGIWSILPNEGYVPYYELKDDTIIGNANISRYFLTVPAHTKEFSVTAVAIHAGRFRVVLLRPDGTVAGDVVGDNLGGARLPWCDYDKAKEPSRTITASAAEQQQEQCWQLLVGFGNDISIRVNGIPKILSLQEEPYENKAPLHQ